MSPLVAWSLLAGFVVLAGLCGWRGAVAPNPFRGPRMLPWRFLMAVFALGALLTGALLAQAYLQGVF